MKKKIKEFLEKSPVSYALQKIILDENKVPCNYEFIYVNEEFERISGLKYIEIIGKTFKELFPDHYKIKKNWMETIEEQEKK